MGDKIEQKATDQSAANARGAGRLSRATAADAVNPNVPLVKLSDRECTVLAGIVAGHTRQRIARDAHIGSRTLERTLAKLQARLEAPTLTELAAEAVRLGFERPRWVHTIDRRGGKPPS